MLVFGTRPEAIKMAPLVKCLQQRDSEFEPIICVTGQHREMLDQVLRIFDIKPDYDLNIMKVGQDLYDITTRVLLGMRDILAQVKPDIVLCFKIAVSSVVCAVTAKAVYGSMCRITPDRIATAAAVFAAVCSYALILLASGAFSDVPALDDKITIFKKKVLKNDGIRNKRKVRV